MKDILQNKGLNSSKNVKIKKYRRLKTHFRIKVTKAT